MRLSRVLFLTLFIFPTGLIAQTKPSWLEYRSLEGRFSIRCPGSMQEKVDTFSTPIGKLVYTTVFFNDSTPEADNSVYMVSFCDYPEGALHQDSSELVAEFLEATAAEAAFSVAGDLVWSTPVYYLKYPGLFWRVDYKNGRAVIKTKAFVVRNRYYAIQTVMPKDRSLNRSAEIFMEAFRLFEKDD